MQKRILIIHDYPHAEGGGLEVQGFLDAKEFVKRGHKVIIASTRKTSETYKGDFIPQKDGVDFVVIESKEILNDLINTADVIHVRTNFSLRDGTMQAMRILAERKIPYFVSIHTNINYVYFGSGSFIPAPERENILSEFAKLISAPHVKIIGISESLRQSLDEIGVSKGITVVDNAKDWSTFVPTDTQEQIPMTDITYAGGLSCVKGIHTFLGAIVILKKTMPDIQVRLIGAGPAQKESLSLISVLGLEENITYLPYIHSTMIPNYLVKTKILALPSLTESWGNIVMEAMGLGTVTVSSRVEGLVELTQNGKYGFLCNTGDASDFAHTFLAILANGLTLPKTQDEVKKYIQEKYSLERRIDALEKIYLSLQK